MTTQEGNSVKRRVVILLVAIFVSGATIEAAPAFRDFMGINGHTIQFKPELYAPVASLARDYHPVEWDLGKDSDFATTFPEARNRVNWQSVYGSWKAKGIRVDACLMFESLKREQWKDIPRDARAYGEAFARAFGPTHGNGLVESVEIGNEPGKWSDADYRVMFENMARGIRAGDPKLKIVTCALVAGKSHDYAKSAECVAGLEDLYDVLNVHSYAELAGWPTWRRSFPEDPNLKKFVKDISDLCAWRDAHAPGKPVWLTEFGYDSTTKKPDPKTEFKDWVGVTDSQQAQWLVRSWLLFATQPIERAYVYFFNDSDQPSVHGSSGLTRNFVPKPSYYAGAHLRKTLGDYCFKSQTEQGEALVAEFAHESDAHKRVDVLWLPTGEGKTAIVKIPDAGGVIEKIEAMPLEAISPAAPAIHDGMITVSESPIYIFVRQN
jgi:serine/threonine-protein kinase ATR